MEKTLQSVTVLGSTGSIGVQTLDVIRQFPGLFRIKALSAGANIIRLASQIREFQPEAVAIQHPHQVEDLRRLVPAYRGEILTGTNGLVCLSEDPSADVLVIALVGMTGLKPCLAALKAGQKVLTGNKETFVAGGHLIAPYLSQILPLDSEHSAIFQCLKGEPGSCIRKIYLTASGGPFRTLSHEELAHVTVSQALRHPNWVMGHKVTIDSATLMNKGLEVIEAHWLFQLPYEKIQPIIHPQSIIHSAVEFIDGSILAQLGVPDMRIPIQYALGFPERLNGDYPNSRLDLLSLARLEFEPPDPERFPCLRLAFEAGKMGSSATAVLNAADEAAVGLFLQEKIRFIQIPQLLEKTLEEHRRLDFPLFPSLEEIEALDHWARETVHQLAAQNRPVFAIP